MESILKYIHANINKTKIKNAKMCLIILGILAILISIKIIKLRFFSYTLENFAIPPDAAKATTLVSTTDVETEATSGKPPGPAASVLPIVKSEDDARALFLGMLKNVEKIREDEVTAAKKTLEKAKTALSEAKKQILDAKDVFKATIVMEKEEATKAAAKEAKQKEESEAAIKAAVDNAAANSAEATKAAVAAALAAAKEEAAAAATAADDAKK